MRFLTTSLLLISLATSPSLALAAPPTDFHAAKPLIRQVYHDQNETLYCGCKITWTHGSSGKPDLKSCGYEVRHSSDTRANRIEWEHIVPAWNLGRHRACWREGGRAECRSTDDVFNAMAGDLYNLAPTVGEVNADRSNYRFTPLPSTPLQHGQCPFKVDFGQRAAEPRDKVKGAIARTYFYMHDRYGIRMSPQQERVLMAWDRTHPVSDWEWERNRRIEAIMGHGNPFITGAKRWSVGYQPDGEGLSANEKAPYRPTREEVNLGIRGNKTSNIYHLPDCPSYDKIAPHNVELFESESDAQVAGYRIAGNC